LKTWRVENLPPGGPEGCGRDTKRIQKRKFTAELATFSRQEKAPCRLQQGALYNSVMDHMLLSVLAHLSMKSLSRLNI
jgi:hypothetical protein